MDTVTSLSALNANQDAAEKVTQDTKKAWFVVYIEVFLLLIACAAAIYLVMYQPKPSGNAVSTSLSDSPPSSINNSHDTAKITPSATPTPVMTNPMDTFMATLKQGDYKVITSGKFEYKISSGSSSLGTNNATGSAQVTTSTSLNLNDGIVYLQKGVVVRLDKTTPLSQEIDFVKNGLIYNILPEKQKYATISTTGDLGKFVTIALQQSLPYLPLGEDTKNGDVKWQKTGINEWQADWQWKTPLTTESTATKVKVVLDPKDLMITTMSMQFPPALPWQSATFQYEKIDSVEPLLVVPPGYTEEKRNI